MQHNNLGGAPFGLLSRFHEKHLSYDLGREHIYPSDKGFKAGKSANFENLLEEQRGSQI